VLTVLGALCLALIAGLRMGFALQGHWMMILPSLHGWIAAIFLMIRKPETKSARPVRQWIAWSSAALPLVMVGSREMPVISQVLAVLGALLSIWALCTLRKSFGVAPSARELVTGGSYRWLRHPMYTGEMLYVLAAVIATPVVINLLIFVLLVIAMALRVTWEEEIVPEYAEYSARVKYRMIPGIW